MFKKKKDNTPKLILAAIGAIATVGGLIFGLTKFKKRNELECEEACCCCDEEAIDEVESADEESAEAMDSEEDFAEEAEEENK